MKVKKLIAKLQERNYRIIKVVNIENKSWALQEKIIYRPQYKRFFLWFNFIEPERNLSRRIYHKWCNIEFDSLEEVRLFLDRQSKIVYYEQEFKYKTK
jgi:hypothetical protein